MTNDTNAPDIVDDQVSDVMPETEVVHVPPATEELMDSMGHPSTFLPEVPDWEDPEQP